MDQKDHEPGQCKTIGTGTNYTGIGSCSSNDSTLLRQWTEEQYSIAEKVIVYKGRILYDDQRNVSYDDTSRASPSTHDQNTTVPTLPIDIIHEQSRFLLRKCDVRSPQAACCETDPETKSFGNDMNRESKNTKNITFESSSSPLPVHNCSLIGGVDVSFPQHLENMSDVDNNDNMAIAVYVILDATTFEIVYQDYMYFIPSVPYIPSFLAFREVTPLCTLIEKQQKHKSHLTPSVILVDGNGILHVRKAGLACFIGVRTNIPTIGVGKTLYHPDETWTKKDVWANINQSLIDASREFCSEKVNGSFCQNSNNEGGDDEVVYKQEESQSQLIVTSKSNKECSTQPCNLCTTTTKTNDTDVPLQSTTVHVQVIFDTKAIGGSCTKNEAVSVIPSSIEDDTEKLQSFINQAQTKTINREESVADTGCKSGSVIRERLVKELSRVCDGVAIPLKVSISKDKPNTICTRDDHNLNSGIRNQTNILDHDHPCCDPTEEILGCVLIGHGGRSRQSKHQQPKTTTTAGTIVRKKTYGTSKPLFLSVGHKMSLEHAIEICTILSLSRIPEPVRQADLIGRDLLRKKRNESNNTK